MIVASEISAEVSVGKESLVYNCSIGGGVVIGNQCVIMCMHVKDHQVQSLWQALSSTDQFENLLSLETTALTGKGDFGDHNALSKGVQASEPGIITIPDRCCLWEVPLKGAGDNRVTLCCGVQDNPKAQFSSQGSGYFGIPWKAFFAGRGMQDTDVWDESSTKDLWNAKLFPIASPGHRLCYALWLMGAMEVPVDVAHLVTKAWRKTARLSLADLHAQIDFQRLHHDILSQQAHVATSLARASIADGTVMHDFSKLCQRIVDPATGDGPQWAVAICKDLLDSCQSLENCFGGKPVKVPASRLHQVQADIARALGNSDIASGLESKAREAISTETADAVWGDHEGVKTPDRVLGMCLLLSEKDMV